jgi:hypothetical protein
MSCSATPQANLFLKDSIYSHCDNSNIRCTKLSPCAITRSINSASPYSITNFKLWFVFIGTNIFIGSFSLCRKM